MTQDKESPPLVPEQVTARPDARNEEPITSTAGDPAVRTTGSTPSLRKNAKKSGDFKTTSLSSRPRGHAVDLRTHRNAKKLPKTGLSTPEVYTSSEYSTTPSSGIDSMPGFLHKRDPKSYERLVVGDGRSSSRMQSPAPLQFDRDYLQSQVDLSTEDMSPTQTRRPPPVKASAHGRKHSDGCLSCGAHAPPLQDMPRAKTLPRRANTAGPSSFSPAPQTTPGTLKKRPTLYAMPTHLLMSSASTSPSPPAMATMAGDHQYNASVYKPADYPSNPLNKSNSLDRAVTGLGNLMEEAIGVARDAAQQGRNQDVANILDNATLALRRASTAQDQMNAGRMKSPLVLSERSSSDRSSADTDSEASSTYGSRRSIETAPTLVTKSAQSSRQPILMESYKSGGRAPASERAVLERAAPCPRRHSASSISRTPPQLYQPPSAESIVRDFAYPGETSTTARNKHRVSKAYGSAANYYHDHGESVKEQPGVRPSISAPMITTDDTPLPELSGRKSSSLCNRRKRRHHPPPIRLLPPVPIDTEPIPPPRSSSRRDLADTGVPPARRERPQLQERHEHLSNIFESSYYREPPIKPHTRALTEPAMPTQQISQPQENSAGYLEHCFLPSETSMLTICCNSAPQSPPQRVFSLKHPRRKHISLRDGQGFSLGRHHRRQPIAREWKEGRKAVAAAIACLNTIFIGLITGIYVSPP